MSRIEKPYLFLGVFAAYCGFIYVSGFVHGFKESHYKAHLKEERLARQRGDTSRAIDEDTAMIALFPDRFTPYMLRGLAYSEQGRHVAAIADDTTSLNCLPHDANRLKSVSGWSEDQTAATLRYRRAVDYENTGQYARALADIEKAMNYEPDMKNARFVRAQANLGLKRYRKAADDFDWAIEHEADQRDNAYYLSAQAQAGYGNYLRAIEDIHKAIEARPEVNYLWTNLGWYQFKAGQVADAIETDRKALSFADQKDANPAFNLGLCYAVTGDEADAHAAYERGLQMPADSQDLTGVREDITDELRNHPANPVLLKAQQWVNGS